MEPTAFKPGHQSSYYSLDPETLFLLRIRAMEDIERIQPNRKFKSEDELHSFLETINESLKYFKELKYTIGADNSFIKKQVRRSIKMSSLYNIVKSYLTHISANKYNKIKNIEYVYYTFGFNDKDSFEKCIFFGTGKPVIAGKASVELQDDIARALGFTDWLSFNNKDDNKYLVSEGVLMRAYAKNRSNSSLSIKTLNVIAQYICDMNWSEYDTPAVRNRVYKDIISKIVKTEKIISDDQFTLQTKDKTTELPNLSEGDKICITHIDGSIETLLFVDGKFCKATTNTDMCA